MKKSIFIYCIFLFILAYILIELSGIFSVSYQAVVSDTLVTVVEKITTQPRPTLDKVAYDKRMEDLAHNPPSASSSTSTPSFLWPRKTEYPLGGALLPFNRIVAYYGNFYSTKMGVLGEYEPDKMLNKLKAEVQVWKNADPTTPVLPAIHYIVTTAQSEPGDDGKYRLRMPESQITKAIQLAKQIGGIVFLDIQIGQSNVATEIKILEKYLSQPNVHLGLDPEFSMKTGEKPGSVIGTMDAQDINVAIDYLANLVEEHNLPPKILVVHRFTERMVTNYKNIKTVPEVQIVMDMDGWGQPENKIATYNSFIYPQPVQFTGFKLFYKNDIRVTGSRMLTPKEILNLRPRPIYIQYQ